MKAEFWLRVAAKKRYGTGPWEMQGTPAAFKNKPGTSGEDVVMKIVLDIPDAFFEEPQLHVIVSVPACDTTPRVTTEIQNGIADVIAKNMGVKVRVSAEPDEEVETE